MLADEACGKLLYAALSALKSPTASALAVVCCGAAPCRAAQRVLADRSGGTFGGRLAWLLPPGATPPAPRHPGGDDVAGRARLLAALGQGGGGGNDGGGGRSLGTSTDHAASAGSSGGSRGSEGVRMAGLVDAIARASLVDGLPVFHACRGSAEASWKRWLLKRK